MSRLGTCLTQKRPNRRHREANLAREALKLSEEVFVPRTQWFAVLPGIVGFLVLRPPFAEGQDPGTDPVPGGVRGTAHLIDGATGQLKTEREDTTKASAWFVYTPTFVGTDKASVYGNAFGGLLRGPRDAWGLQLLLAPKLVDDRLATHLRAGGEAKATWSPPLTNTKTSLKAAYQNTVDVSTRQDYVLAFELAFPIGDSTKVALGTSADYLIYHPVRQPSIHTTKLSIGTTFSLTPRTDIEVDYSFKNIVDNGDDASLTLFQTLISTGLNPTIIVTAGKGRVIALSLLMKFKA